MTFLNSKGTERAQTSSKGNSQRLYFYDMQVCKHNHFTFLDTFPMEVYFITDCFVIVELSCHLLNFKMYGSTECRIPSSQNALTQR